MKYRSHVILFVLVFQISSLARGQEGFILKAGNGEAFMNGIVMKVSPSVGSSGPILAEQTFPRGGTTSVHAHDQGDEIFYVVSGRGVATLRDDSQEIGPGDVILITPGEAHSVSNPNHDEPLVVVFFMATPEIALQMRAIHELRSSESDTPITPEDIEAIRRLYGGSRPVTE